MKSRKLRVILAIMLTLAWIGGVGLFLFQRDDSRAFESAAFASSQCWSGLPEEAERPASGRHICDLSYDTYWATRDARTIEALLYAAGSAVLVWVLIFGIRFFRVPKEEAELPA